MLIEYWHVNLTYALSNANSNSGNKIKLNSIFFSTGSAPRFSTSIMLILDKCRFEPLRSLDSDELALQDCYSRRTSRIIKIKIRHLNGKGAFILRRVLRSAFQRMHARTHARVRTGPDETVAGIEHFSTQQAVDSWDFLVNYLAWPEHRAVPTPAVWYCKRFNGGGTYAPFPIGVRSCSHSLMWRVGQFPRRIRGRCVRRARWVVRRLPLVVAQHALPDGLIAGSRIHGWHWMGHQLLLLLLSFVDEMTCDSMTTKLWSLHTFHCLSFYLSHSEQIIAFSFSFNYLLFRGILLIYMWQRHKLPQQRSY